MSTVAKILVVLNLALAAVFLGSASNFLGQQDNFQNQLTKEKEDHAQTRSESAETIAEKDGTIRSLGRDLTAARGERDKAQTEAQRITGEVTHLREAYNQLSANATVATRSVEQLTNSLNAARDMIQALQSDNGNLHTNLLAAQENRDAKVAMVNSLQMQLGNETEARKALEARASTLAEQIKRQDFELTYFKDRFPGHVASAQPAQTGRILASDNKNNVFVISLGEEDGVKAGFQYIVSRGAQYIATIQIDNVQAKQAAGSAVKSLSKGSINRGDVVMNNR